MFRTLGVRTFQSVKNALTYNYNQYKPVTAVGLCRFSSKSKESDEEFDARYESYFNRPDIDGWEIRKAMNDLTGMDLVPEPKIVIAALKACRRVNDFALAVRYLESVKEKCGNRVKEIYPYMLQEIRPTLDELGINTPEEMGYDKPELDWEDVFIRPLFPKN